MARLIAARNDLPFTVRTATTLVRPEPLPACPTKTDLLCSQGSPHHGIKYLDFLPRMNGNGGK